MAASRRSVDDAFAWLVGIDKRLWPAIFFGVVGLYTIAVIYEASGYSAAARLFPIVIGVPFMGLIFAKLALLALSDRFSLDSLSVFDIDSKLGDVMAMEVEPVVRYRREFSMLLWLAALSVMLWAIGFLITLLGFVLAFVTIYERDPVRGAITAGVTYGIVYFFFVELLGATIYRGAYPINLPVIPT